MILLILHFLNWLSGALVGVGGSDFIGYELWFPLCADAAILCDPLRTPHGPKRQTYNTRYTGALKYNNICSEIFYMVGALNDIRHTYNTQIRGSESLRSCPKESFFLDGVFFAAAATVDGGVNGGGRRLRYCR